MNAAAPRQDVYERVNNRIVEMLEAGIGICDQLWARGPQQLPKRWNGEPYRGVNCILLWCDMMERGFSVPIYMTYKQAQELGGQVQKGAKSAFSVYADKITKMETDAKGEEVERHIPFLKSYAVFPVELIDGLPARFYAKPEAPKLLELPNRLMAVDAFVRNAGAKVEERGDRAFYSPGRDLIVMPPYERFKDREAFASVLLHETVHFTGHESRLNRPMKDYGTDIVARAEEEIVAEVGSAFLCATLEITPDTRPDHAAYVASWLKAVKSDKRYFVRGAAAAQKAADYLYSLQPAAVTPAPSATQAAILPELSPS